MGRRVTVAMLGALCTFSNAFPPCSLAPRSFGRVAGQQSVQTLSAKDAIPPVETKRLFVAVELNDADKQSVVRSMDDFRSSLPESRVGGVLKWVKPANLHITLTFLGDTPVSDIPLLEASLEQHLAESPLPPFYLTESKWGCFERDGVPTVLWLGLSKDCQKSLRSLFATVDRACKALPPSSFSSRSSSSSRRFDPHITLARVNVRSNARRPPPPAQQETLAALVTRLRDAGAGSEAQGHAVLSTHVPGVTLFESQLQRGQPPVYSRLRVFSLGNATST